MTAVDFMDNFVRKNAEINSSFGNIDFLCADVTKLEYPDDK